MRNRYYKMDFGNAVSFHFQPVKTNYPQQYQTIIANVSLTFSNTTTYGNPSDNRPFRLITFLGYFYKYIVGNSSMMTPDFNIPFLLMSLTILEL